ncbi:amidase domain-containing protein [Populibacterium corticicola]|uniref:Amidase domain-containing protein n=1 Tax=Populibacterium corticicola TaxID=1812826 RepID=A0ABW5XDL2_9MICO
MKKTARISLFLSLALVSTAMMPSAAIANQHSPTHSIPVGKKESRAIEDSLIDFIKYHDEALVSERKVKAFTRPKLTQNSQIVNDAIDIRTNFEDAGFFINQAETDLEIHNLYKDFAGNSVIIADITTNVISESITGEKVESSWTDRHRYEMSIIDGETQIISDTIDNDLPESSLSPQDTWVTPEPEEEASIEVPIALDELPPMTILSQPKINTTKFADYATLYTGQKYQTVPQGNPSYADLGNNCANFASQTLRAAGWQLKNGVNPKDASNWHYNLSGLAGASRTWSQAKSLYSYAKNKQGWTNVSNVYNTVVGDLIFADWDPNGKADGAIDHVMVVSKKLPTTYPMISQKSPNRHNVPINVQIDRAKSQKTKIVWYALRHK